MGYLLFKYLLLRQLFKIFSLVSAVRVLYILRDDALFFLYRTEGHEIKGRKKKKEILASSVSLPSHPSPLSPDSLQPLEGRRTQPYVWQVDFLSL